MTTEWSFTGEQNDPNGLVYLRARYYDPAIGRFVSRDPWPGNVFSPQSLTPYQYVLNSPTNYTDPFGLDCSANPRDWGSCATKALGGATDLSAVVPYGGYYLSYQALDRINDLGPYRLLIPGEPQLELGLLSTEVAGLGGDVGLDWLRLQLVEKTEVGIWDEGRPGSICPDPVEYVLGLVGIDCPQTYLPGLHREGGGKEGKSRRVIDLQW